VDDTADGRGCRGSTIEGRRYARQRRVEQLRVVAGVLVRGRVIAVLIALWLGLVVVVGVVVIIQDHRSGDGACGVFDAQAVLDAVNRSHRRLRRQQSADRHAQHDEQSSKAKGGADEQRARFRTGVA
jgi:hypothetical protein